MTITTRSGKGSALTNSELDANFTHLGGDGSYQAPSTKGTAGQVLRMNSGGTALEFGTVSGGGSGISELSEDTTPQLGGDLDVGTHRIETTESQMNFEVDSDASSTGYEGYYFYGGPTTNGYNRIWITGTETALQQRVGSSTAYTAFIQNNNQYSVIINEHGGNHPAKITNWGNGSSAHLNIGVRHADAKVRFTDHTGNTLRYAFPNSTPSSGQVLTASDSSGTLSWATASGGNPDLYRDNASSATTPSAAGTNAVAIGSGSSAGQTDSIAIGGTAYVGNSYAVALGYDARVSGGDGGTALGRNARASGADSVAVGKSYSSGDGSFAAAIANNTSSYGATGANSIAIGDRAKSTQYRSIAIGLLTQATGDRSTAIGVQTQATANYATAIGMNTYANGTNSVSLGSYNYAQQYGSISIGMYSKSDQRHKLAFAGGGFNMSAGSAQQGLFILRSDTTDATPEALTTNGSAASTDNQIVLSNNSAYGFTGTVIAREDSSSTNDFAVWEIKGGAVRAGSASTTALGSYNINRISESAGATNWSIALSADTTNGAVAITVTGEASHSIRWVATVNTTEVIY